LLLLDTAVGSLVLSSQKVALLTVISPISAKSSELYRLS